MKLVHFFPIQILLLLAVTCPALAYDSLLCDPCAPSCSVFDSCYKSKCFWDDFKLYGWLQTGLLANNHGMTNKYDPTAPNGPCSQLDALSGNSYLLMSGQQTDLQVNQLWLGVAKPIDVSRSFDWGIQYDMFFGTDAKYGQSFGDQSFDYGWGTGDYYLSIPQLYGEVGGNGFKMRAGKFAPSMVTEALPAPATFFYSHAYICFNTPLTVTGAVGEYTLGKKITLSAGWTAGSLSSFRNRFGDNGFIGSVAWRPTTMASISYNIFCASMNGLNKRADAATRFDRNYDSSHQTVQTLVLSRQIGQRWTYIIEGLLANNSFDFAPGDYTSKAYGINQHLIYTINDRWKGGLRAEWHHADGTIFDIPPLTGGESGDIYEITLGLNWNPIPNFNVRPELRYDWTHYANGFKPFNNGRASDQLSGGCAMMVNF